MWTKRIITPCFFSFLGAQEARHLWRSSPALMELMWLKRGISFTWKSFVGGGRSEENMDSSWSRFTQAALTSCAAAFSLEGGEWIRRFPTSRNTEDFFFYIYFWIFPQLLHNSCCRPNLLTGRFICLFFCLLFLGLRSKFFLFLFLNQSLQLVPITVPYLILVFDPDQYMRWNEHISSYKLWKKSLFLINIVCVVWVVLRLCQRLKGLVNQDLCHSYRACHQLYIIFCFLFDKYAVFKLLTWDWGEGHSVPSVSPQGLVTFH